MIDPVTLAVVNGRLVAIADEMNATLFRAAFSPIIAEAHDACHGIYHPESGGTLVQGHSSLPIFTGTMGISVKQLIDRARGGRKVQDGDVFLTNDPYIGGTHVNDIRLIRPVFHEGAIIAFVASAGHWIDLGGNVPGNFNPSATECFQEGVQIPLVKIADADNGLNTDIVDILLKNSRVPRNNIGDLNAQFSALEVGARRLTEAARQFGPGTLAAAFEALTARADEIMRASIKDIPNGCYSADDFLDNDGITDAALRVALDMRIDNETITFDFSRSSHACAGPLNIGLATTIGACYVAIKHIFPEVPANFGCFRPINIIVPPGSLLAAESPRPVGGYNETVLRVASVVFQAFAKAAPERSFGVPYTVVNPLVMAGHHQSGERWVMFIYFGGGLGGSFVSDGLNHGCNPMSVATMPTVEQLESSYPVRFRRWSLRTDSEGAGSHRGGVGAIYEIELAERDASFTLLGDRGKFAPAGVCGGDPAALNRFTYMTQIGEQTPALISKITNATLAAGKRLRLETPGGGGYGNPRDRLPELVAHDVREGYISERRARDTYGVALSATGQVDLAETLRLRAAVESTKKDARVLQCIG